VHIVARRHDGWTWYHTQLARTAATRFSPATTTLKHLETPLTAGA